MHENCRLMEGASDKMLLYSVIIFIRSSIPASIHLFLTSAHTFASVFPHFDDEHVCNQTQFKLRSSLKCSLDQIFVHTSCSSAKDSQSFWFLSCFITAKLAFSPNSLKLSLKLRNFTCSVELIPYWDSPLYWILQSV